MGEKERTERNVFVGSISNKECKLCGLADAFVRRSFSFIQFISHTFPDSYPAVYIITVLPVGIARFRAFQSQSVPYAATIFADFLFCCSGLFNVVLFSVTRPALMPHRQTVSDVPPNLLYISSRHNYELSSMTNAARADNLEDKKGNLSAEILDGAV